MDSNPKGKNRPVACFYPRAQPEDPSTRRRRGRESPALRHLNEKPRQRGFFISRDAAWIRTRRAPRRTRLTRASPNLGLNFRYSQPSPSGCGWADVPRATRSPHRHRIIRRLSLPVKHFVRSRSRRARNHENIENFNQFTGALTSKAPRPVWQRAFAFLLARHRRWRREERAGVVVVEVVALDAVP